MGETQTTLTQLPSEADFNSQISSLPESTLAVIYFHAPWAEPCKQMTTVLQTLASTYPLESPPSIAFLSLDAEELSDVSEKYEVTAVPYIVLQKGGKTLETVSGSDPSKVRAAVEKYVGKNGNSGKLGLPPAQTVTKNGQEATSLENGTAKSEGGVKNLGSYTPTANDPATAPADSSGEQTSKEELFERLGNLVKAAPVMLFMKGTPSAPQCGFSRQTVNMLRERSIRYGFFNILADDEIRQGLKEFADWPTYPQLWVGGELVGGLDIIKEEFENDPEFLKEYSLNANRNTGGPAAPEAQAQPS